MKETLFGMETEYAFSAWSPQRKTPAADRRGLLREFFEIARERLVYLPDDSEMGMFIANGSRFYKDAGEHLEHCTPECRSPLEVVRWTLAGERLLVQSSRSSGSATLTRALPSSGAMSTTAGAGLRGGVTNPTQFAGDCVRRPLS